MLISVICRLDTKKLKQIDGMSVGGLMRMTLLPKRLVRVRVIRLRIRTVILMERKRALEFILVWIWMELTYRCGIVCCL